MSSAIGRMMHAAAGLAAAPFMQPAQTVLAAAAEMVGGAPARRCWSGNDRCWIEVRGLRGENGPTIGNAVLRELRDRPGVRRAQLNHPLSRVIIEFDGGAAEDIDSARLCDIVAAAESSVRAPASRARPTDLPGDGILLALKGIAAAASGIGIGVAVVGRTLLLPRAPGPVLAIVSAIDYQPKVRAILEARLGTPATDAVLSLGAATVYALTQAPAEVTVEFVRHVAQLAESAATADAWQALEPRLAAGAECPAAVPETPRPCPLPDGVVERYAERCARAQVLAAAAVGALARDPAAAATAAVVTAPKAARNSREAFASTLGRGLADRRELVPLRPDALRILDRIDAVVVDPRILATDTLQVGRFREVAHADRAAVWQWAQDRLQAGGLTAGWHGVAPAFTGPARNGEARGQVLVRNRHDPRASGVLAEIRRAGAQAVSLDLDHLGDLRSSFDELRPAGDDLDATLAQAVGELQRDGRTVAVLSVDAPRALGRADLAVGMLDHHAGIPWQADVLAADLAAVWRLLHAMPAARRASERGVELAAGGTLLGALLMVPGVRGRGPGTGDRGRGRRPGQRILAGAQNLGRCRTQADPGRGLARDDARPGDRSTRRTARPRRRAGPGRTP